MSHFLASALSPVRGLLRRPGFSAVVVLTLTLGIGAATAVFSIFNGVLLTPLPFLNPHELVNVYDTQPACKICPASFPKYHDWATRNTVFRSIGGLAPGSLVLTGGGDPERLPAARTTASFFDVFGVAPILGRTYTASEDRFGGPKLVVLSHAFWMRRFQGSPTAVGQKLILDGEPYEVIGVMPAAFVHRRSELYIPFQRKLDPATRGSHFMPVFARLKAGVSVARAQQEMRSLGATLAREFGHNHGIDVVSYTDVVVGQRRTPLSVLLGAVLLLLLTGVANVANLMLASGLARRRELAIRAALGAGLRQLAGMLIAEGLWLAVAGGVLGVFLSRWLVSAFIVLAANQLPRANEIHLDFRVLAFSIVLSAGVGLTSSLFPVLWLHRADLSAEVREGDTRTGSHSGNRLRRGLVVAEIALAFGLIVSSALLSRNLMLLRNRDAGIRTAHIVAFDVSVSGQRYQKDTESTAFYRELYARLGQLNGVRSAGLTSHLPMVNFGWNGYFRIEGEAPWKPDEAPLVEYRWIYGDYLKTMGVPLFKGRVLDRRDGAGTRTVLINKAMADKFWPGKDPIGRRFGQEDDKSRWFEVVGVIGSVRSYGLTRDAPFEFYRNIEQSAFNNMTVVLETQADDPLSIIPLARQVVRALDPSLPITQVQTMERAVADSLGQPRLMSALTGLFGGLAGLLAMVGVYSVMAYNVNRHRREFGIRLALGAGRGALERLVLGQGLWMAALGVVIGAAGSWMFTGALKSLLNDVAPHDPFVFTGAAIGVLAVALLASHLPARSASRVDPIEVLRAE